MSTTSGRSFKNYLDELGQILIYNIKFKTNVQIMY